MVVEIAVELGGKRLFRRIFDTEGATSIEQFRRDFYVDFARENPDVSLANSLITETWTPLEGRNSERMHANMTTPEAISRLGPMSRRRKLASG